MLNHRFTINSPLIMGPTAGTAAYNAVIDSWEVFGWILSLFLQCGYQIEASGDGDLLWGMSNVFTTMAWNNSDMAPMNPKQVGPNSPNIAGSTNNYACWFTVTNPADTPESDRCWWTFQFGYAAGVLGTSPSYLCLNIFFYSREPDFTLCSPTRCPMGTVVEEELDEILMAGGLDTGYTDISDVYSHPTTVYSYPIASFFSLTYWNFGFDDDPDRSVWWFTYSPQGGVGGKAGVTLICSDLAKSVPYGDRSRCVGAKITSFSYGITEVGLSYTTRTLGRYDVISDVSVIATAYGGGEGNTADYPVTYCVALQRITGAGKLVPDFSSPTTSGRGTNSLGNGEEPLPVKWATPDTMDQSRCGGMKGDSTLLLWNTNGSETQLAKKVIGSVTYVLMGQVWIEVNDGAVPGLAGAAFAL